MSISVALIVMKGNCIKKHWLCNVSNDSFDANSKQSIYDWIEYFLDLDHLQDRVSCEYYSPLSGQIAFIYDEKGADTEVLFLWSRVDD